MAFRARPVPEDFSKPKIKEKTTIRRKRIADACEVQSTRRLSIFHKDPQHGMLPPWRQKESEAEEREESTNNFKHNSLADPSSTKTDPLFRSQYL